MDWSVPSDCQVGLGQLGPSLVSAMKEERLGFACRAELLAAEIPLTAWQDRAARQSQLLAKSTDAGGFPLSHSREILKRDLDKSLQPRVELVCSAGHADSFYCSSLFVSRIGTFRCLVGARIGWYG